ncbi:MAG: hypothetical protein BGO69_19195 [Bacteroidetes bacterium 46-16]|nr:MAG: hypothetical protein BGO69_19195 [Bacteroidetes bacterium 46-16]
MQEQIKDADIIQQVLKGQQAVFSILVDRYGHFVFTIALKYVNSREEAEELAQDTFVKAYRFLADFNNKSKFSTWLYTIAHNTCLSFLRKKQGITIAADEEQINMIAERSGMAEQASHLGESRSQKKVLAEAIHMLPPADAELINLFYMAGQSIEEIGLITGMDANNVKVKLFRARQKLRSIIEKYYRDELSYL